MPAEFVKNLERAMEYLHKKGAFLTTKNGEKINVMTISWGNIGYEWGKPVFTVMVRHSRYSHELIEDSDEFTISIPMNDSMKKSLAIAGSKTGRSVNKFESAGLTTKKSKTVSTPVIEYCGQYYECKIVYKQDMNPGLLSEDILKTSYADGDFHTIYYGEIVDCYTENSNV